MLLVCSLAAGCAVGPKYRRPDVEVPPAPFATEASGTFQTFGDLRWFEVFKDEALLDLIKTATSENFDVRIAANRMLQAEQQVRIARGDELPAVEASFAPQRGITTLSALNQGTRAKPISTYTVAGSTAWEVDLWGKLRKQTEAARATYLAAKENRDLVRQSLVITLAQVYISLRELDAELDIARRTLDANRESLTLVQVREQGGVANRVDVQQAESLVETAAHAIPIIQQQIALDEHTITFLLAKNPGTVPRGRSLQDEQVLEAVPAGLPSALLERRPDIRMAEQQLIAANARVGVAKASLFPTIGLTAANGSISTALADLFTGTHFWSIGASALQPIFEGGALRANYQLSQAQKEELVLQYARAVQQAFRETADALVAVEKTREARVQQEALTATLAEQRELSNERYKGGVTTFLEVLDSERQYFAAQQAFSQAQRDELLGVVSLYRALGGGWQTQ
jgi:multidrug efflux system outer membrane protein